MGDVAVAKRFFIQPPFYPYPTSDDISKTPKLTYFKNLTENTIPPIDRIGRTETLGKIVRSGRQKALETIELSRTKEEAYQQKLIKKINREPITFTDKILNIGTSPEEEKDFFVYWIMEGRKTLWNKGTIMLARNNRVESSFREAFELKYGTRIPETKTYDQIILQKISREMEP